MTNYLLEGKPGVGKTTLLHDVASCISTISIGGFYTEEIRELGKRVGFRIRTFKGESGILSHAAFKSGPHVGKYRVDVATFEAIGVNELQQALDESELILIDEIGKMELFSERFQHTVLECMDSSQTVLATVMSGSHPFVDQLRIRPDVKVTTVTLQNRNRLVEQLLRGILAR